MHSWHQLRAGFAAARHVDSIRLLSGAGYSGSVLTKSIPDAGTWYVDGVDTTISTTNFTLTDAHSGKKITFRTPGGFISNVFEMFMPDDRANLAYWFDASDTANIVGAGGSVSTWFARAGLGAFVQVTAGLQPTHSNTGRNGRPAVSGNGTDRFMNTSNISSWPDENETESMFALCFCPNTAALEFRCIFGHGSSSTKARQLLKRDTNGGSTQQDKAGLTLGTSATDTFVVTPAPTMLGVDTIVFGQLRATDTLVWVNGQYTATKTTAIDTDGNTAGALFKFPFGGTPGYWPGSVQDIFGYSDELTTADRQRCEGYIAHRWGVSSLLAVGHPYKTLGPRIS